MQALIDNPRSQHLVAFCAFAVATGLRMRNITHLTWDRVSIEKRQLRVEAERSKSRRRLDLPLADDAVAILEAQKGQHPNRVFTYHGNPYDRVGGRALRRAAVEAGVTKHLHPHLFRHTFASWHVMGGTSLYDLMALGGWQKIESVMVYAHLAPDYLHAAAANRQRVHEIFLKKVTPNC